jgi:putative ABC transport system permease protein
MRTLAVFAAIALALAIAGSYAMLMFAVVQRTRELALRQALGATAHDLVLMVGREVGEVLIMESAPAWPGRCSRHASCLVPVRRLRRSIHLSPRQRWASSQWPAWARRSFPARRASNVDPMLVLRGEIVRGSHGRAAYGFNIYGRGLG